MSIGICLKSSCAVARVNSIARVRITPQPAPYLRSNTRFQISVKRTTVTTTRMRMGIRTTIRTRTFIMDQANITITTTMTSRRTIPKLRSAQSRSRRPLLNAGNVRRRVVSNGSRKSASAVRHTPANFILTSQILTPSHPRTPRSRRAQKQQSLFQESQSRSKAKDGRANCQNLERARSNASQCRFCSGSEWRCCGC